MPNRLKLSALLCLLSLPALSLGAGSHSRAPAAKRAAVPPAPHGLAAVKADVVGLWSYHDEFGLGDSYTYEVFFGSDGAFEVRSKSDVEGDTQALHAFGTWTVVGGEVVAKPDGNHCKSEGTEPVDCSDSTSDILAIDTVDDMKSLVETDGGYVVGEYAGAARAFTLPDLFSISALSRAARANPRSARSLVFGSGTEILPAGFSYGNIDAMGRSPGGRMAAGIRIRTTAGMLGPVADKP